MSENYLEQLRELQDNYIEEIDKINIPSPDNAGFAELKQLFTSIYEISQKTFEHSELIKNLEAPKEIQDEHKELLNLFNEFATTLSQSKKVSENLFNIDNFLEAIEDQNKLNEFSDSNSDDVETFLLKFEEALDDISPDVNTIQVNMAQKLNTAGVLKTFEFPL